MNDSSESRFGHIAGQFESQSPPDTEALDANSLCSYFKMSGDALPADIPGDIVLTPPTTPIRSRTPNDTPCTPKKPEALDNPDKTIEYEPDVEVNNVSGIDALDGTVEYPRSEDCESLTTPEKLPYEFLFPSSVQVNLKRENWIIIPGTDASIENLLTDSRLSYLQQVVSRTHACMLDQIIRTGKLGRIAHDTDDKDNENVADTPGLPCSFQAYRVMDTVGMGSYGRLFKVTVHPKIMVEMRSNADNLPVFYVLKILDLLESPLNVFSARKMDGRYASLVCSKAQLQDMIEDAYFDVIIPIQFPHENIVKVYRAWIENHRVYILMEYVQHGTVIHFISTLSGALRNANDGRKDIATAMASKKNKDTKINKEDTATEDIDGESSQDTEQDIYLRRGLPACLVRTVGAQLASALSHLHSHGFMYRDLHPGNILLGNADDNHFKVRLIDFGRSRPFKEDVIFTDMAGSKMHQAPEMLAIYYEYPLMTETMSTPTSPAEVDVSLPRPIVPQQSEAMDVWQLGVFLMDLLKGAAVGMYSSEVDSLPHGFEQKDFPNIPQDLIDLIKACTAFDPAARPSMQDILTILSGNDQENPSFHHLCPLTDQAEYLAQHTSHCAVCRHYLGSFPVEKEVPSTSFAALPPRTPPLRQVHPNRLSAAHSPYKPKQIRKSPFESSLGMPRSPRTTQTPTVSSYRNSPYTLVSQRLPTSFDDFPESSPSFSNASKKRRLIVQSSSIIPQSPDSPNPLKVATEESQPKQKSSFSLQSPSFSCKHRILSRKTKKKLHTPEKNLTANSPTTGQANVQPDSLKRNSPHRLSVKNLKFASNFVSPYDKKDLLTSRRRIQFDILPVTPSRTSQDMVGMTNPVPSFQEYLTASPENYSHIDSVTELYPINEPSARTPIYPSHPSLPINSPSSTFSVDWPVSFAQQSPLIASNLHTPFQTPYSSATQPYYHTGNDVLQKESYSPTMPVTLPPSLNTSDK
jgi:serine/threonine protein kinase